MIKAGFIGAIVGFIYVTSLALLIPLCTLCFTPLLGVGVGYLASWFDRPQTVNTSVNRGIIASAIAAVGAIGGQMLASIIYNILLTNSEQWPIILEQLMILMREFGLTEPSFTDTSEYWQTTMITNGFCGLINWGIIMTLGAVGGMLWFRRQNSRRVTSLPS
jgi:hypothetical protein